MLNARRIPTLQDMMAYGICGWLPVWGTASAAAYGGQLDALAALSGAHVYDPPYSALYDTLYDMLIKAHWVYLYGCPQVHEEVNRYNRLLLKLAEAADDEWDAVVAAYRWGHRGMTQ